MPIEQVREGTPVLSQPEEGGKQDYRPALKTTVYVAKEVWAVRVLIVGEEFLTTLIAAHNQPFWVEEPSTDGEHWIAADCLEPGSIVQLANGDRALVHMAGVIRQTQFDGYGFAVDRRVYRGVQGVGLTLLATGIVPAQGAVSIEMLTQFRDDCLVLAEPHSTVVFTFEVEGFHTIYVGDTGVWANNKSIRTATTIADRSERQ